MTLTKDETEVDALAIDTIRTLSMDGVQKANSGHPGAPMALAPVAYQLFAKTMKHNPADPDWFDRDRFVLSAGHASMLLYSILHLTGYGISMDDLKNFRQILSPTAGHPEYEADGTPGIEITTGPLGQGVGNAVGFALAERLLAARFNRDGHEVIDHHTYAIASDGDMQEGVASEASSLAGHLALGKLTVFYDNNQIQLAGPTSMGFSEKVGDRYEAYNWHVQDLGEDLSTRALAEAIEAAHADDRPSLIIVQSHIGFGSPNKQDSQKAHGSPLGEDEVKLTKEAYGWDPEKTFYVPDEAAEAYAEVPERGKQLQSEWEERLSAFRDAHGDLAAELDQFISGDLPDGWDADLPRVLAGRRRHRHPQGLRAGDPVGREGAAHAGQRLGRPRALDQHRDRGRRLGDQGRLHRPQRALRRARARHGGDRQRRSTGTGSGPSAPRSSTSWTT